MDDKMRNLCDQLEEYSEIEGTELGEACNLLITLARYDYCLSNQFVKSLEKEVGRKLKDFQENAKIVEREVTSTQTYKEIAWN